MSPRTVILAALAATVVVLSGCSPADDAPNRSETGSAQPGPADEASPAAPLGDRSASGASEASATGPRRIRRAEVTVEVADLHRAAARVSDIAAAMHGYVSGQSFGAAPVDLPEPDADTALDSSPGPAVDGSPGPAVDGSPGPAVDRAPGAASVWLPAENPPGEGRVVLRVPSDSLSEALDQLVAVGRELNRWSAETEVEGALVDLESRVASQTASVQRLRALLDRATSVSDVVTVESELARREADLESLKGRLQSLSDRAAMATVTVVLRTPERTADALNAGGFLAGLRAGSAALARSVVVLLTALGAVLPFAAVAALAGVPLVRWRRRRARRRPAAASGG